MLRRLALALLLVLAPLAGCLAPLELPEDQATASAAATMPSAAPPEDRIDGMTAEESKEDVVGPCERDDGIGVSPGTFCGTRVLTVEGRIGLDALPVELVGVNGPIALRASEGDAWSLLATIKVRAATEEGARKGLDEAWTWSHEDGEGGHRLKAGPTDAIPLDPLTAMVDPQRGHLVGTVYEVRLPAWVLLDVLSVTTSNGPLEVAALTLGEAALTTSNGAIVVAGAARHVDATTSNGPVEAVLAPTASGTFSLTSSNGPIGLALVEDAARGYRLDATTSNGPIEIRLRDGDVREDGRGRATFETTGYEAREIQTAVALSTSNGPITVVG